MLEYVVGDPQTYLFALTREGGQPKLKAHELKVSRAELQDRVTDFRERLARHDLNFREAADKLYGLLEAWELMKLDLNADLVVLSACETARGRVGAGEGVIGLSWALFVAGAPSTLVSQWKVASESTAELMLGFHRRLCAGGGQPVSKAEALRQSVLRLMQRPQYRHPFYWAGFVLVGDAQ